MVPGSAVAGPPAPGHYCCATEFCLGGGGSYCSAPPCRAELPLSDGSAAESLRCGGAGAADVPAEIGGGKGRVEPGPGVCGEGRASPEFVLGKAVNPVSGRRGSPARLLG